MVFPWGTVIVIFFAAIIAVSEIVSIVFHAFLI